MEMTEKKQNLIRWWVTLLTPIVISSIGAVVIYYGTIRATFATQAEKNINMQKEIDRKLDKDLWILESSTNARDHQEIKIKLDKIDQTLVDHEKDDK